MQLRLKYQRPEHGSLSLRYIEISVGVYRVYASGVWFDCADKLLVDGYSDAIVALIIDSRVIIAMLSSSTPSATSTQHHHHHHRQHQHRHRRVKVVR